MVAKGLMQSAYKKLYQHARQQTALINDTALLSEVYRKIDNSSFLCVSSKKIIDETNGTAVLGCLFIAFRV